MMKKFVKGMAIALLSAIILLRTNNAYAAYNGIAAVKYAETWWNGYNTSQYYKADKDCTNFVSQCLVAGGQKPSAKLPSYYDTGYWRPHSATWENATYWRKYWKDKTTRCGRTIGTNKLAINNDLYSMLGLGDVIQWGYSSSDIHHSQLVEGFIIRSDGIRTCYMIQHTDSKRFIDLYDYLNATYFTYACGYHFSPK